MTENSRDGLSQMDLWLIMFPALNHTTLTPLRHARLVILPCSATLVCFGLVIMGIAGTLLLLIDNDGYRSSACRMCLIWDCGNLCGLL